MKKIKVLALVLCCITFYQVAQAQNNTGKVYVIRSLNYVGSAVNIHVYADDSLVCKIKNKRYSVHELPAGEHTFKVQNTGLSNHKKSVGLKVVVEPGKINYIAITSGNALGLMELTPASGEQTIKPLITMKSCLGKE